MNTFTPTVEDTIAFMKEAHGTQVDWGGKPYYLHPLAVYEIVQTLPPYQRLSEAEQYETKVTALLHDVIEDTKLGHLDLLLAGYTYRIVTNVVMLTRPASTNVMERLPEEFRHGTMTYLDKIRAIAATGHIPLILVKLADNKHNSDHSRRAGLSEQRLQDAKSIERKRYQPSMKILSEALGMV